MTGGPQGMVVVDLAAWFERRCTRCGHASAPGNRVGARSLLCRRCVELIPKRTRGRWTQLRKGGRRAAP